MAIASDDLLATDIEAYLDRHEKKDLLRFITCGSVDDGKSTLIGRLLYDTKLIFEDQLASLEADSRRVGTQGERIDFALLVDGLAAEREQGITIDVAYRFFTTDQRKFIVADTPGHEQYTRNMVTGASTAQLAVLLVDARKGVITQTRRHSFLVSLMGIDTVVVAINKMDLVHHDQSVFDRIAAEYEAFAARLGIANVVCIPISALDGDNVITASPNTPWYHGPALLPFLETVSVERDTGSRPFRLPVQWVSRPDLDFRGFAGTVAAGRVGIGDPVVALPGGQRSSVARIVGPDGDVAEAFEEQAVTLCLADEIDVSRGSVLAAAADPPEVADQFQAHVVWMAEEALLPGRAYLFRIGTQVVAGKVTNIRYQVNVNTLEHAAARHLDLNAVAVCNLSFDRPVVFEPYEKVPDLGAFVVIDRMSNRTVGAGMIDYALRRAHNIHWQHLEVDKDSRAELKGQKPCVLWFTGLSGSGKSTVANLIEKRLLAAGRHTYLLDGDNVRHGLNRDLGFTNEDRVENIRRVAEVSRLFVDAGMIVLVSFISPFRSERRMAREMMGDGEFLEIFMDVPLEVCERRDVKGLYRKAREGKIKNFTGIDSEYEVPEQAEIRLAGADHGPEDLAEQVFEALRQRGIV